MNQKSEHLPEGYQETLFLNVSDPSVLAKLNVLGFWGLGISVVTCFIWVILVRQIFPAPIGDSAPHFITSLIIIIGVLPLHEWVHGMLIRFWGYRPRYGAKWIEINKYIRLPYLLYATTDKAYFNRFQFITIALAPLIAITTVGFFLIALLPYGYTLTICSALIMNGSGAVGDIWMTWLTLKSHPQALIKDEADAIRIFEPI